jgi:hypothetical protein
MKSSKLGLKLECLYQPGLQLLVHMVVHLHSSHLLLNESQSSFDDRLRLDLDLRWV